MSRASCADGDVGTEKPRSCRFPERIAHRPPRLIGAAADTLASGVGHERTIEIRIDPPATAMIGPQAVMQPRRTPSCDGNGTRRRNRSRSPARSKARPGPMISLAGGHDEIQLQGPVRQGAQFQLLGRFDGKSYPIVGNPNADSISLTAVMPPSSGPSRASGKLTVSHRHRFGGRKAHHAHPKDAPFRARRPMCWNSIARRGRLDHLDRHAELLELRAHLRRVADDDPDEALGIERRARRLVEARRRSARDIRAPASRNNCRACRACRCSSSRPAPRPKSRTRPAAG